jgi:hypothetical protein
MNSFRADYHRLIKEIEKQKRILKRKADDEPESITLFIRDEDALIEPYSGGDALINTAVIDYLESRVRDIPLKKRITIEIEYGGKIPGRIYSDDPFLPEKLIKKNLEAAIMASLRRNARITARSLCMALVGIAILGLINRIPFFDGKYAFNELFVVISWVFLWNFVESFFFERIRFQLRRIRLLKIHLAEYRIKTPR